MTIPLFGDLMLPLLRLAADQKEHQFREAAEALSQEFKLSQDDKRTLLPSQTAFLFDNRVGWARLYLVRAGLLEPTRRGFFRITSRGQALLKENLSKIDEEILQRYREFVEFKGARSKPKPRQEPKVPILPVQQTP